MKKIIVAGLLLLSLSFSANYPSIPRVFGPGSLIPIGYLNEDFNAVSSAFSSGLYKANFNQLYINNTLFIDANKNIQLNNLTITGNITNQGNLTSYGNLSVSGNMAVSGNATIQGTLGLVGTLNLTNATISSAVIASASITKLNSVTIDASIITILQRYIDKTGFVQPVGTIAAYGGTTAPTGWFLCDGSTKDITAYNDLFKVISGNYGVSLNANYYYLPDMRGRFLRGLDSITVSRDPDALTRTAMNEGGNVSRNIGSVETDAFQGHEHQETLFADGANFGYIREGAGTQQADRYTIAVVTDGTHGTPRISNETRPINVYLNYIIKW